MEKMGPRDGGVVGEGADEPERGERAFVAGAVGMRRSKEAKASEERRRSVGGDGKEEGWRRRPQGMGSEPEVGKPSNPCKCGKVCGG